MKWLSAFFLLFVPLLIYAGGDESGYKIYKEDIIFFEKVKKALRSNDRTWIATHIHYPICTVVGSSRVLIRGPKELEQYYSQVFDKAVVRKIVGQDSSHLFVNWEGRMAADGALWFDVIGNDYSIISVNGKNKTACPAADK